MELKSYYAQDIDGAIIPGAYVYLYEKGTTTLVTGIEDAGGNDLANPFQADEDGFFQIAAPDGVYDLRVTSIGRDKTIRVQFLDASAAVQTVSNAADQAETEANRAQSEANRAELGAEAALTSGWIYSSVSAGETARSDGDYFWVVSTSDDQALELWLMGTSSASDTGKRTLSSNFAISNIENFEWEQGGIATANGVLVEATSRIRTPLYKALYLSATVEAGKLLNVFLYDDDGSFITQTGYMQSYPLTRIDCNFRISVKNDPDDTTDILPSENGLSGTIDFWTKENIRQQALIDNAVIKNENGKIDEHLWSRPLFEPGSAIESWSGYDPDQFISLEIWDREESDSFYLNTLYRFFYISAVDEYQASLGFKRVSDNKHVCAAPAQIIGGTDPNLYARWVVTQPPSGIQQYYLYIEGDTSNPPIGLVKINWDLVPTGQVRYIGTDGLTPAITQNLGKTVQKTKFVRSNETLSNPFLGKKIVGLGDSITYGFIPRNDPGYPGQLDSWLVLVANMLGMTHVNYGISGSTLGDVGDGSNSPFTQRYQSMDDDADLVVVMGGTNDFRKGVPLGVMSDRTDTTYYGALHVLCEGLIDKYHIQQGLTAGKGKQIVFMTPPKIQDSSTGGLDTDIEPYVGAIKEVCAYYSIPVFDSYTLSGLTPHILQTLQGTETGYTDMYNPYIPDGTHPNQEGHEMWAKKVAGFISSLSASQ